MTKGKPVCWFVYLRIVSHHYRHTMHAKGICNCGFLHALRAYDARYSSWNLKWSCGLNCFYLEQTTLYSSRECTYPPQGNSRVEGGLKCQSFKGKYEAKPEFPEGLGDLNQKTLLWEGYEYFLEQHISILIQQDPIITIIVDMKSQLTL